MDAGVFVGIFIVGARYLLGISKIFISEALKRKTGILNDGEGVMIENQRLYSFSILKSWKSLYQTTDSKNQLSKTDKKGALGKFIDYVREQGKATHNRALAQRIIPSFKQIYAHQNKTKGAKSFMKIRIINSYTDLLKDIKSQLDTLG